MSRQRAAAASATTHLDSVVSNLPWGDPFDLGAGLDAVTGEIKKTAIDKPDVRDATTKSSTYSYRLITSESELDQEIEVAARGKYNMDGVNLSASAEYVNQIKFSDTSTTLVAHYQTTFARYDEADEYALTAEAKQRIGDPTAFRSLYGDYFIAGARRGSRFTAVYRCTAKSAERLDSFKATVGADTPEVFSAEGSTKLKRAATENDVDIDVQVEAVGYEGNLPDVPQDPDGIIKLLKWFVENEKGVPVRAKLRHYSQLDPAFPTSVPIAPSTFVALGQLYLVHWRIEVGYASLPAYYQNRYQDRVSAFTTALTADSDALPTDADTRREMTRQAQDLHADLRGVIDRQDFYFRVADRIDDEPKRGQVIQCVNCGPKVWLYGYATYNQSPAVHIHSVTLHMTHPVTATVFNHTFQVPPDQDRLVVGWEVRANRRDAGEWKKTSDQILLKDAAEVWAQSNLWGRFDWTVHVYYVDAADYQFG